jgi:hypothetical protein
MDTPTLKEILKHEMNLYAKKGLNAVSYLTISADEQVYAVIDFGVFVGKRLVGANLIVRLIEDMIYIDIDNNNKMLVDALRARGVPENQMVLMYQQDTVPVST